MVRARRAEGAGLLLAQATDELLELGFRGRRVAGHERLEQAVERALLAAHVQARRHEDAELRLRGDAGGELRVLAQVHRDLAEAAEAAHGLKGRERDGHLGLVVVVLVDVGPRLVEPLRQGLVRVGLDAQALARAQDFQQPRELAVLDDFPELRAVVEERRAAGVRAEPELGVGRRLVDGAHAAALDAVARDAAVGAADAPRVPGRFRELSRARSRGGA